MNKRENREKRGERKKGDEKKEKRKIEEREKGKRKKSEEKLYTNNEKELRHLFTILRSLSKQKLSSFVVF